MEHKLAVDISKAGVRAEQASVEQDFSHIAELCLVLIYYKCCLKKKLPPSSSCYKAFSTRMS